MARAPLLWVVPLALYLLTFVLVFRDPPLIKRETLLFLHLIALAVVLIALSQRRHDNWFVTSSTGTAVFFTTAMLAHRTLYEARPAAKYLTEFYLWMSFGGALGGMFTALVAPNIFSQIYEYPLLLALSMACRPGALKLPADREKAKDELVMLWLIAAVGILAIMWLPTIAINNGFTMGQWGPTSLVVVVLGAVMLASVHFPPRQLVASLLVALAICWLPSAANRGDSQRSFFGVYRVHASRGWPLQRAHPRHDAARRAALSATRTASASIAPRRPPTTTPAARSATPSPSVARRLGQGRRAATVSSGSAPAPVPATSARVRRGASSRSIRSSSRSPRTRRTSPSSQKCQPDIDIVIGDARLTMAREQDASFDLFIIDAFTSDAIPVHMLTKEAVEMYLAKLKSDGVVLLHTSNRYLDLNSVLGAILKELPQGTAGIVVQDRAADGSYGQSSSTVVVFTKSEAAMQPYRTMPGVSEMDDGGLRAWTDDYSDILGPFLNRVRPRR